MADVFVDLLYRGLALGSRVRLAEVAGARGYLEVPAPMPVGTMISVVTGEDAVGVVPVKVLEVVEQTAGSERPPGMVVRPTLDGAAALAWWRRLGGDAAGSSAAGSPSAGKVPEPAAGLARAAASPAAPVAAVAPAAAAEPVPAAPSVPDAAASSSSLDRGGVVSAALDDQPTMPTEVAEVGSVGGVSSVGASVEAETGESSNAEDPDGAEPGAGDSTELARADGEELPEPPSVAGAAPRGRKRRRNRR